MLSTVNLKLTGAFPLHLSIMLIISFALVRQTRTGRKFSQLAKELELYVESCGGMNVCKRRLIHEINQ